MNLPALPPAPPEVHRHVYGIAGTPAQEPDPFSEMVCSAYIEQCAQIIKRHNIESDNVAHRDIQMGRRKDNEPRGGGLMSQIRKRYGVKS